ncbi:MAG: sodium/proton-translocating pyrophosphatase [Flavonifractor plautii]
MEAGIPEDDPRNPATIADNVGDNVGDVAGMGADLYESYVGSILATFALGASAYAADGLTWNAMLLPLIIAVVGVVCSVIGTFLIRTKENATQKSLLATLRKGTYTAACWPPSSPPPSPILGAPGALTRLWRSGGGAHRLFYRVLHLRHL